MIRADPVLVLALAALLAVPAPARACTDGAPPLPPAFSAANDCRFEGIFNALPPEVQILALDGERLVSGLSDDLPLRGALGVYSFRIDGAEAVLIGKPDATPPVVVASFTLAPGPADLLLAAAPRLRRHLGTGAALTLPTPRDPVRFTAPRFAPPKDMLDRLLPWLEAEPDRSELMSLHAQAPSVTVLILATTDPTRPALLIAPDPLPDALRFDPPR